jgi:hypothetical protein
VLLSDADSKTGEIRTTSEKKLNGIENFILTAC